MRTAEHREVRLQRQDRPWEMWLCQFEQAADGAQIIRCGVCLRGVVDPRVDAVCGSCGAVVTYVYQRQADLTPAAFAYGGDQPPAKRA